MIARRGFIEVVFKLLKLVVLVLVQRALTQLEFYLQRVIVIRLHKADHLSEPLIFGANLLEICVDSSLLVKNTFIIVELEGPNDVVITLLVQALNYPSNPSFADLDCCLIDK